MNESKKQIFISYHREDLDFVQQLSQKLEATIPDIYVIYDTALPVGESFAKTLVATINSSEIILIVLSPSYVSSAWAKQEMNIAIERSLYAETRLIPVIVRPCKPHGYISMVQGIDFTKNHDEAFTDLIWGITGERPLAAIGSDPGRPTNNIDPDELAIVQSENRAFKESLNKEGEPPNLSQSEEHRCFVIMPFNNPDLQHIYDFVVLPAAGKYGKCERGDDAFGGNVIMDDVLKQIRSCTYAIADLTGQNSNVFYELGICHALKKPVLLLAQSVNDLPFDLRHRRVQIYDYSPPGVMRLKDQVEKNLQEMLRNLAPAQDPAPGANVNV
ncbi:toll/interleukin-1 receptor domain-containing protein [Methylorubrum extorquens]|uniref:toll/interleukin-1 receptor domain-containing protein n=1 Tax=Methylorubrum extorquens TaxID=408 RepID=UPI002237E3B3|nr:toll/interleukin-1 receptor domain-containing protein [Methylorubrum extorquens]UYW27491.1 toll/interleukin-1 receptor domain-containing protein [Methylorubrum extorquens]